MTLPHWRLISVSLFQAVFGWGTTCDMVIINPLVNWVKDFANASVIAHYAVELTEPQLQWVWSSCTGIFMLGGIVGSATIKYPAEYFGRRITVMIIKNVISLLSLALHLLAKPLNSIECLLLARFFSGMAFVYASMVTIFVSECSPVHCRGAVSTATVAIGNCLNSVIGTSAALMVTEDNWHYVYLVQLPLILIHFAGTPFVPESIKHLYITENDHKQSRKATVFYQGTEVRMEALEANMKAEADVAPTNRQASLKSVMSAAQLRLPLFLCCVLFVSQTCSGFVPAMYYSASTLVQIGVPQSSAALYSLLLIQFPSFLCALLALCLVESVGRRCLLLIGFGLLLAGSISWSMSSPLAGLNELAGLICEISGMALSLAGARIGPGMLCYMVPGELAPQTSRSLTFGIGSALNWVGCVIVAFGFPPVYAVLGTYSITPFVVFMTVSLVFIAKYMPETKNKTVREIVEPWMPARKVGQQTAEVETVM